MIRGAWIVLIALAAHARRADACSCDPPRPFVSGAIDALPPGASLYVFVPAGADDAVEADLGTEIHRSAAGSVRRVRGPGGGSFSLLGSSWEIAPQLPPAPPLRLRTATYEHGTPMCGPTMGFQLHLDGGQASAYRLRWTRDGQRREAYLPAKPGLDGSHVLRLGDAGCDTPWLSARLDGPLFEDAELSMLTFDGAEVVVARGTLEIDAHAAALPTFRAPPPSASPAMGARAWTPAPRVVWWRVISGAVGGCVLGALASWLVAGRRRRAT